MMTSSNGDSALLAICEFPAQRPVTQSLDVFVDLRLNKRLSKQSWGWWFETPSPHYGVIVMNYDIFCEKYLYDEMTFGSD